MSFPGISGKNVLYGCLDWGNGHVFRSIPIIRQLLLYENRILVFCSERQKTIFWHYLKDAVDYHIGFTEDFHFSGSENFFREIWRNRSHFLSERLQEKRKVEELVRAHSIDLVISDHRYGLVSEKTDSLFLTHQLHLPAGILANLFHRKMMKEFSDTLILDRSGRFLAGKLSRGEEPDKYIGWFSRFKDVELKTDEELIVAVLSGPDVYAEQLMHKIEQLKMEFPGNWRVISTNPKLAGGSKKVVSNLSEADELIASASRIVSRSGYTTLMDLEFLKKRAILIPTKGQSEQEYLASIQEKRTDRTIIRI